MVSQRYSNAYISDTEIQAYAKISGKDWTYFVKELEIIIGRNAAGSASSTLPPQVASATSGNGTNLNLTTTDDPAKSLASKDSSTLAASNYSFSDPTKAPVTNANSDEVHIDLGPAKVVSRHHATIRYNLSTRNWELIINGRNGARLDTVKIKYDPTFSTTTILKSGSIIDISGTQMMFILPDATPQISPKMLTSISNRSPGFAEYLRKRSGLVSHTFYPSNNNTINNNQYNVNYQQQQLLQLQSTIASSTTPDSQPQLVFNYTQEHLNYQRQQYFAQQQQQQQFAKDGLYQDGKLVNSYGNQVLPNGRQLQQTQQMMPLNNNGGHLVPVTSSMPPTSVQAPAGAGEYDLSKEDAKNIKPPYSYATMITKAILLNPEGVMSLAEIYDWISLHYAFYRYSKSGWQNSIRHNLSLNRAFDKVPRRPDEPGKGMKWQISEAYKKDFLESLNTGAVSKIKRGSSVSKQLHLHLNTYHKLPKGFS